MLRCDVWKRQQLATNKDVRLTDATNGIAVGDESHQPEDSELPAKAAANRGFGKVDSGGRTTNRRSREAYNAYQREYMRRKRAANKSRE